MRLIKQTLLALTISISLLSCKDDKKQSTTDNLTETKTEKSTPPIAAANLQTASFEIEGMTCAMGCAKTIEEELADLNGVQKAVVDFDTKTATVTFDKTVQNQESFTKVVQDTGDGKTYKVSKIKA